MSTTVYFGNVTKRRNSTLQPSVSNGYDCIIKEATSLDHPTFILEHSGTFAYNYCKWSNSYYFVDDVISRRNNIWEVSCVMDVLATYKTEILASTQFVCYSSYKTSDWLVDTRVPILAKGSAHKQTIVNPALSRSGSYVLSVVGKTGCELFRVTKANLATLLDRINTWSDDVINDILDGVSSGTVEDLLETLQTTIARSGTIGNAYLNAPSCIRSCIWVPFAASAFTVTATKEIYLGQFPTGVYADAIASTPFMDSFTFTIGWTYTDWRRSKCEDVYLYLPLVGLSSIDSENIASNSSMTIDYSLSPTDGAVAYEVKSGNQVIGSYGASCSAGYPIGINQQASAGEMINSVLSGAERIINMGVNSSLSPVSGGAAAVGAALEGVRAGYDAINTQYSRHNSCIGGIGGGVGAGLDLSATLYIVDHDTAILPSAMQQTMGLPTMQPMSLSSLSGYCQCANAHVAAPAAAHELDAIDGFLNAGFYIE